MKRKLLVLALGSVSALVNPQAGRADGHVEQLRRKVQEQQKALRQAEQELDAVLQKSGSPPTAVEDSPFKGAILQADTGSAKAEPRLSWEITFPATYGYETNPRKLADDILRPFDGPKSSFLTRLNPGITFLFDQSEATQWQLSYDVLRSYYHGAADIDRDTHTWNAAFGTKLAENLRFDFAGRDTLVRGGSDNKANVFSLNPSLAWTFGDNLEWTVKPLYLFSKVDAHDGPVFQENDADQIVHTTGVSLSRGFAPWINPKDNKPVPRYTATVAYSFAVIDGDGSNKDLTRHQIGGKMEGWFFPDESQYLLRNLKVKVEYAHKAERYRHAYVRYDPVPAMMLGEDPTFRRLTGVG